MSEFCQVLLMFFLPSVELFGVELICPDFIEGTNIVTCKINKTAFDAECQPPPAFMTFDRTLNETSKTLCKTKGPQTAVCEKRDSTDDKCWCVQSDQGIFTYKFHYMTSRSQDLGALLECKYCPNRVIHLKVTVNETCKNISFVSADTTSSGRNIQLTLVLLFVVYLGQLIVDVHAPLYKEWSAKDCCGKEK